ncbi:MAG TPA: GAF domain-containing protein [Thermodesulfobacteriota bacterium]|nr:GAF domain-containing protein [Thermodesulfobacteriota bacterium]
MDERFQTNPLVVSDPKILFYAGVPLVMSEGYAVGTLCVMDYAPRSLSLEQIEGCYFTFDVNPLGFLHNQFLLLH